MSERTTRTSRGKRNPKAKSFRPNDPFDDPILLYLNDHRLLRTSHLAKLTGRSTKALNGRMRKLKDHGYVSWVNPKKEADHPFNPEDIFALGNKGADRVAELRRIPRSKVFYTSLTDLNRDIGRDHVSHTLLVSDFLVRVRHACNNSNGRIRFIPQREIFAGMPVERRRAKNPLAITAMVYDGGVEREKTTIADAFFGLDFPESNTFFFLEADRGTMVQGERPKPDWRSNYGKYQVYYSWFKAKGHLTDFDIDNFRVLFLTSRTEERVREAIANLRPIHPSGWGGWLFSWKEDLFSHDNILEAPWITGKGGQTTLIED